MTFKIKPVTLKRRSAANKNTRPGKRPNIIVITTDHHSNTALASNGFNRHSPGSDRLANEGVAFTHATTTTEMCGPARCAMQTGMFPNYLGVPNNRWAGKGVKTQLLPPGCGIKTLPDYFKPAGYTCGFVGKLHMSGNPLEYGYDDFSNNNFKGRGKNRYFSSRTYAEYQKLKKVDFAAKPPVIDQTENALRYCHEDECYAMSGRLVNYTREHTYTACNFDEGKRMISCYKKLKNPFVVHINLDLAPHWPYIVPEPYASMYKADDFKPWANFRDPLSKHPLRSKISQNIWRTNDEPWERWAESLAKYYGLCAMVEDEANELLTFLDDENLSENSIVIWTADHGAVNGAHGIFDKDFRMVDEIYRIPLLVRWPMGNLAAGKRSSALVHNADILPTIMELSGISVPETMQCKSFVPALRGEEQMRGEIDFAFWSNGGDPSMLATVRAIRTHDFKYVFNAGDIDEFYDLKKDPAELENVIDEPAYAEEVKNLRKLMHQVLTETDDFCLPFARERLLGCKEKTSSAPLAHYLETPNDFGLRTNCPWHFK
ncbi:MAG TPA: hypothetical protein DC049_15015 [Spirochaetia bacterium]|nr:hypothetical protein [Spirochaetia bacterium]